MCCVELVWDLVDEEGALYILYFLLLYFPGAWPGDLQCGGSVLAGGLCKWSI